MIVKLPELKIVINCDRKLASSGEDYLAVEVNISKIDQGMSEIWRTIVNVTTDSIRQTVEISGDYRGQSVSSRITELNSLDGADLFLHFRTSEETQFRKLYKIPSGRPSLIEVTVSGKYSPRENHRGDVYGGRTVSRFVPSLPDS